MALCGITLLSGYTDDPYQKTKIGAAMGAGGGVLAGGGAGLYMDKQ